MGDVTRMSSLTHGHTTGYQKSRTYRIWRTMKQRCDNPKAHGYARYGGRGIRYAKRWARFENFLADMGVAPDGLQLDRIRTNGNYTKGNCRWATRSQNQRNQRRSIWLTFNGRTQHLYDWARELGVSYDQLRGRLRHGWTVERTLSLNPVRCNTQLVELNGITKPLVEWARETRIDPDALRYRLYRAGWDVRRALTTPGATEWTALKNSGSTP